MMIILGHNLRDFGIYPLKSILLKVYCAFSTAKWRNQLMALLSDGATWFLVFRMQEVSSLKRRVSMNFAHKEVQLAWRSEKKKYIAKLISTTARGINSSQIFFLSLDRFSLLMLDDCHIILCSILLADTKGPGLLLLLT